MARMTDRAPWMRDLPGGAGPLTLGSIAAIGIAAMFLFFDGVLFSVFEPGADWAPLWVGGKLSWTSAALAYDIDLVSSLQGPLMGPTTDRPFVYPPSALLLFAPLSALPFTASFLLFGAASIGLLLCAARPFGARPVLLLLAPPLVLAIIAGQPTILVAALVMFGLTQLDRNESRAGVLLAMAAMIKPPLLLLAPIAMAGGGYWRAFAAAAATAVVLAGASLAVFGLDAWLAWLAALPKFKALVTEFEPLLRNAVTPYAMAVRLDIPPALVTACAALVAVPFAWASFARSRHAGVRLVALVGGALLISPYAMNYELAVLAPVVAAWRLEPPNGLRMPIFWAAGIFAVAGLWAASLFMTVSLAGLLAVYVWAVVRLASEWRETRVPAEIGRRAPSASRPGLDGSLQG